MEQREIDKIKAEEDRIAEEERKRIEELEKPPFDVLYGQRLHAWVLLLPGRKDVESITFVEPTTGTAYNADCPFYFGIESIWNNINYWVNLQDCSNGLVELDYDLTKLENWEHFIIGEPFSLRESEFSQEKDEDEIKYLQIIDEKHLDMPSPWSSKICISHENLKQRFLNGVKKTWYKRTLVEEFTPFIQEDGLVTRVCRYYDLDCSPSDLYYIEEFYENRADNLVKVNSDCLTGDTEELFVSGREDCLKQHFYKSGDDVSVEKERVLDFYHHARHDGLSKISLDALYITELYENTEDGIYYRHIDFAPRGHPPPGVLEGVRRIVVKIIEKFHRNENKPASEDIATREFALIEGEIRIKYHYEQGKVTASTRDFIKPPLAEMGEGLRFRPELTIGYQSEMNAKTPRQLQLFYLFEQQLEEEGKTLKHIRDIEDQILEILKQRCIEKAFPKLDVSLFDREHNEEHRKGMKEREQQEKEHREREVEDEVDYLTPYLARLGKLKGRLFRTQAAVAREWCLNEFKQMLLDRANDIQQQFDTLSCRLQEKQQWHIMVQDTLSFEEETQYFEDINEMQFLLRSLDIRLARHRDLSPFRYELLENYLNSHPKLAILNK
ncbi:hypothetical protein RN001_000787 [Aquatica leii]|uniref:Dynein regulatory complex subunit 7 n=1 Tax=Aquatica leii TaxID=1421715 RepID=A0AAN7PKJ6_9COLE|nr:hypothetical protein RN001_000787 [Aquatica leii]